MFTCKHGVNIREECNDCNVLWDERFAGPPPAKSGLVIRKAIKPPAQSDYLYEWRRNEKNLRGHNWGEKYSLMVPPSTNLYLWKATEDKDWNMRAVFGDKRYTGKRDTLEEAFRAICGLLHKEHADIFWRIDARVVVDNWRGELPCTN